MSENGVFDCGVGDDGAVRAEGGNAYAEDVLEFQAPVITSGVNRSGEIGECAFVAFGIQPAEEEVP